MCPNLSADSIHSGMSASSSGHGNCAGNGNNGTTGKRKRSWSRAVFSNLQRKGLEKRFQIQKYITKPDRRQLAATLGLTDAQVKVWFQNRRMKWRHCKESKQQETLSQLREEQTQSQPLLHQSESPSENKPVDSSSPAAKAEEGGTNG